MLASYLSLQFGLSVVLGCVLMLRGRGQAALRLDCARGLLLVVIATSATAALVGPEPIVESLAPLWRREVPVMVGGNSVAWQAEGLNPVAAQRPAPASEWPNLVYLFLSVCAGARLLHLAVSYVRLFRLHHSAQVLRRFSELEIRLSSDISTPVAYLGLGWCRWRPCLRRVVLLDDGSWRDDQIRRVAVAHEIQHHRQGDPAFAHVLALLTALTWPNPLSWYLPRALESLEEHACDEAVLRRGRVKLREYCRVLLAVAQRGLVAHGRFLSGQAHRAMACDRSLLQTRIKYMTSHRQHKKSASIYLATGLGVVLAASGVWAAKAQFSRGESASEAAIDAVFQARGGAIEIPDRPELRAELQAILGDPARRERVREAIERSAEYTPMIEAKIGSLLLPRALRAIPIVESRFRSEASQPGREPDIEHPFTLGLWQFIPATARAYGLRVDAELDQRSSPAMETQAALELLRDLHAEFDDWGLSFAGYYQGNAKVRAAIEAGQTRDIWTLMDKGLLERYPQKIMTAMLLMDAPELLD